MIHLSARKRARHSSQALYRPLGVENLEERRVLAAYISEFQFSPIFGDNTQDQYLELRGAPASVLPSGTYFVGVESADGVNELGDVHTVIDLSGVAFGGNGYLVLLQSAGNFATNSSANILRGTSGFNGLPNGIYEADGGSLGIHAGSSTYFLVQTNAKPSLTDDIDANDDGVPDGAYLNWTILDGFTTLPSVETPFNQRSYAPIVFAEDGAGDGYLAGSTVVVTDQQSYAGRIGGSIGYARGDWLTGNTEEQTNGGFDFQFQHGVFGTPRPEVYGGRYLDHVGGPNWFGSVAGSVFEDLNADGIQQPGELPLDGLQVLAEYAGEEPYFWETIEPNDYLEDTDLTNISNHVTLVSAGANNVHQGFKAIAVQRPGAPDGEHIFSHAGVGFFNENRRLRMDFYRPVRSVSIDITGNASSDTYGRLEIFNSDGASLGFMRTGPLGRDMTSNMSLTSAGDNIAWAIAYSEDSYLNSSPFGILDSLRIEVPRSNEIRTTVDGQFSIAPLLDDGYNVSIVNSDEYYTAFPSGDGTYAVSIAGSGHVGGLNFGMLSKVGATLEDQLFSVGEHIVASGVVGSLPMVLGYPGQELQFSILDGDPLGQFRVDPESFNLISTRGDLDFETQTSYSLTVEFQDANIPALKDSATVQVMVQNQNDAPQVEGQSVEIDEGSAEGLLVATMVGSDQDAGQAGEYEWSIAGGNTDETFSIDGLTGEVRIANPVPVNFEQNPVFSLVVRATDKGTPSRFGEGTLTVNLLDLNEVPVVREQTYNLAENSPALTRVGQLSLIDPDAGETITWSISGADAAKFEVFETGALRVKEGAVLDFETQPQLFLSVQAVDSGMPPQAGNGDVTIQLTDANDAPVLESQEFSIDENSAAGVEVGMVVASDQDSSQALTFSISGGRDAASFAIDSSTGRLTVSQDADLNFEVQDFASLEVTVTDSASASQSNTMIVRLVDVNDPPAMGAGPFLVKENSVAGTDVVFAVDDEDTEDTHVFEILSQSQPWLAVDVSTGQLQIAEGADIDFESGIENQVVLKVSDRGGLASTATITVTATDENDPPMLVNPLVDATAEIDGLFEYAIPEDTFIDVDAGDALRYAATTGQGFPLPTWLFFDSTALTLSGTPTSANAGTLTVLVTAIDRGLVTANDTFDITVGSTAAWNNVSNPLDVSNDGSVVPRDALLVINYLNNASSPEVPANEPPSSGFVDVNGDNFVTAIDALLVINFLNSGGNPEGEFVGSVPETVWDNGVGEEEEVENVDALLALLAFEQLHRKLR